MDRPFTDTRRATLGVTERVTVKSRTSRSLKRGDGVGAETPTHGRSKQKRKHFRLAILNRGKGKDYFTVSQTRRPRPDDPNPRSAVWGTLISGATREPLGPCSLAWCVSYIKRCFVAGCPSFTGVRLALGVALKNREKPSSLSLRLRSLRPHPRPRPRREPA